MRLKTGTRVRNIQLPAIDGSVFDTKALKGRPYMLSFYRFATCPFCNLRVHELGRRLDEFGEDFSIVAIFDSPLEHLTHHTQGHRAPFPILADERRRYYKDFGIEHSWAGVFKGIFFRFSTLVKGIFEGYVPWPIKGSFTGMPADFLIDREGRIQVAYYAKDEGDHLPFEEVKKFSYR